MKQFSGTADAIQQRFAEVQVRVDSAATASGRQPGDVEILVATKYVPVENFAALHEAGVHLIGENRVQDMLVKHERFGDLFTWDFIGHLQSRKTKDVLPIVRLIHSVDSMSVVREIQDRADRKVPVLLEINVDAEETKNGVTPDNVDAFLDEASGYDMVDFTGLMCMPPLFATADLARPSFARARELAGRLSQTWSGRYTFARLSMGTSADYEVAVLEGATIVRVGSVLF
ncbi:MAG: YggS family pyridoxal phosphate-dependent enzyme [Thermoleophilia bacterium]